MSREYDEFTFDIKIQGMECEAGVCLDGTEIDDMSIDHIELRDFTGQLSEDEASDLVYEVNRLIKNQITTMNESCAESMYEAMRDRREARAMW